jgi:hypothetical protein
MMMQQFSCFYSVFVGTTFINMYKYYIIEKDDTFDNSTLITGFDDDDDDDDDDRIRSSKFSRSVL